jgi:histone deacetylase complex regulatory component SIN3
LLVGFLALQVAVLFRQHADLLTEFTYFLPDNSPPQVHTAAVGPALAAAAAAAQLATVAAAMQGWGSSSCTNGLLSLIARQATGTFKRYMFVLKSTQLCKALLWPCMAE